MRTFHLPSVLFCLATALLAAGCQQKMADQPSYQPLEPSDFFVDGRSARPLVPGTVARGQLRTDRALFTGRKSGRTGASREREPAPQPGSDRAKAFDENLDFVEDFPIAI